MFLRFNFFLRVKSGILIVKTSFMDEKSLMNQRGPRCKALFGDTQVCG